MDPSEEYERRALEVEESAAKTPPGLEREAFLKIARQWRLLAEQIRYQKRRGV
jgi:hypothetical protein